MGLFVEYSLIQSLLMWNLKAASKITQSAQQKRNYQLHKNALKNIRPTIRVKSPQKPIFLYTKPKKQMADRDRLILIDKQNSILLHKLTHLQKDPPQNQLRPESQWLKTLNQQTIITLRQRIDSENRKICNRLMSAASHYPTARIVGQTNQLVKIRLSISQNARRINSSRCSLGRPHSAALSSASKFVRTGQRESIVQNKLQLTADRTVKRDRPESAPSVRVERSSSVPGNLFMQNCSVGEQQELI